MDFKLIHQALNEMVLGKLDGENYVEANKTLAKALENLILKDKLPYSPFAWGTLRKMHGQLKNYGTDTYDLTVVPNSVVLKIPNYANFSFIKFVNFRNTNLAIEQLFDIVADKTIKKEPKLSFLHLLTGFRLNPILQDYFSNVLDKGKDPWTQVCLHYYVLFEPSAISKRYLNSYEKRVKRLPRKKFDQFKMLFEKKTASPHLYSPSLEFAMEQFKEKDYVTGDIYGLSNIILFHPKTLWSMMRWNDPDIDYMLDDLKEELSKKLRFKTVYQPQHLSTLISKTYLNNMGYMLYYNLFPHGAAGEILIDILFYHIDYKMAEIAKEHDMYYYRVKTSLYFVPKQENFDGNKRGKLKSAVIDYLSMVYRFTKMYDESDIGVIHHEYNSQNIIDAVKVKEFLVSNDTGNEDSDDWYYGTEKSNSSERKSIFLFTYSSYPGA